MREITASCGGRAKSKAWPLAFGNAMQRWVHEGQTVAEVARILVYSADARAQP